MFSSCCSPITLIAAATSRTFSTRLLAVTITASRSVAPAAVEATSGAVDPSASWASAAPAVERATAAPMARASRERREHPVGLDAVLVVLPGDRKRVVVGKSGSVRVDLGGRRILKKKNLKSTRTLAPVDKI